MPFSRPVRNPLVMAHRGGSGLWPQNTMRAFQGAAALEVDVLELDIHLTKDGAIVVMHDPTVDSTTDGHGFLRDMTLAEIKSLDAGYRWTPDGGGTYPYRGQIIQVPTLEEVLAAFQGMRYSIDIKSSLPEIIEPFCRLLEDQRAVNRVMVGSFHDAQLARFRSLCPSAAAIAGVGESRLFFLLNHLGMAGLYRPPVYSFSLPEYNGRLRVVTPGLIRAAHAHGIEVHIWTVDDASDMRRLIDWGASGLITDFPDRLLDVLAHSTR